MGHPGLWLDFCQVFDQIFGKGLDQVFWGGEQKQTYGVQYCPASRKKHQKLPKSANNSITFKTISKMFKNLLQAVHKLLKRPHRPPTVGLWQCWDWRIGGSFRKVLKLFSDLFSDNFSDEVSKTNPPDPLLERLKPLPVNPFWRA